MLYGINYVNCVYSLLKLLKEEWFQNNLVLLRSLDHKHDKLISNKQHSLVIEKCSISYFEMCQLVMNRLKNLSVIKGLSWQWRYSLIH